MEWGEKWVQRKCCQRNAPSAVPPIMLLCFCMVTCCEFLPLGKALLFKRCLENRHRRKFWATGEGGRGRAKQKGKQCNVVYKLCMMYHTAICGVGAYVLSVMVIKPPDCLARLLANCCNRQAAGLTCVLLPPPSPWRPRFHDCWRCRE